VDEKVMILDGTNLLMRAVFASRGSAMEAAGVSTGALVVFVNGLSRLVRDEEPDRLVVCWDSGRSRFRTALDPGYKANRKVPTPDFEDYRRASRGLVRQFLSLAGIHHVDRPDTEADDLVAAYWRVHRVLGDRVVIVSSDKDFLQLLEPGVEQVRLSSADTPTDRWDHDRVVAEYGCDPSRLPLVMALTGDASDAVPGVHGFGPKKAVKALALAEWELGRIPHESVVSQIDRVRLNLRLVDLRHPREQVGVAPEFAPTGFTDAIWPGLIDFVVHYQLASIEKRLYAGTLWWNSTDQKSSPPRTNDITRPR
jgi:DNA polymerase-1